MSQHALCLQRNETINYLFSRATCRSHAGTAEGAF